MSLAGSPRIWGPVLKSYWDSLSKGTLFIPYAWPNIRDGVNTYAADKMNKEDVTLSFAK